MVTVLGIVIFKDVQPAKQSNQITSILFERVTLCNEVQFLKTYPLISVTLFGISIFFNE